MPRTAINKKATDVVADLKIGIRPAVRMALAPDPCTRFSVRYDPLWERSKYLALEREHDGADRALMENFPSS